MWHVHHENVRKNKELESQGLQLHHVGHLVPAEADKPVVLGRNEDVEVSNLVTEND